MAQAAAKHSSSIMAYLLSAGDKNRDPAWTIRHLFVFASRCFKMNPRPFNREASA
jgi:hypothetical protein